MSTTNTDRFAKQLAKDWGLSLSAARDIRARQIEAGSPSVNDLMPTLLTHFDHRLRDFGSLCLGVQLRGSRAELRRWTVPGTDVRALAGIGLAEGCPVFIDTDHDHPATVISGGRNSGKTTMLHSLIEQAVATTSPIDTGITVLAAADAPIRTRLSHLADRVVLLEPNRGIPHAQPSRRQLIFIDDADLYLPGNAHHWTQITEAVNGQSDLVRVFLTAATAAPRVVPRELLTRSVHANLRGGTLPILAPDSPWRFTVARAGSTPVDIEGAGFCMSDLPAGTSPVAADNPRHVVPHRLGEWCAVFDENHEASSPSSVGLDSLTRSMLLENGVSYRGGEVIRSAQARMGEDSDPVLHPAAEKVLEREIARAREACTERGRDFEKINRTDCTEAVIDMIREGSFPPPVWYHGVGRFLAEDPGTWG